MRATVAAQVVNIALAVLFIFVLQQGVAGAATATVIAHGVEAGVLALSLRKRGFGLRLMTRDDVIALFRVGFPTALQFVLEVGAFAMLSLMISLFSEVDMAAHQIAIQVIHFSFLPAFAVAEAGSVLSGQAVGAGSYALVTRVARLALVITGVYTAAWSVLLTFGSGMLVAGFTPDVAVVATAVQAPPRRGGVPDVRRGRTWWRGARCAGRATCATRPWWASSRRGSRPPRWRGCSVIITASARSAVGSGSASRSSSARPSSGGVSNVAAGWPLRRSRTTPRPCPNGRCPSQCHWNRNRPPLRARARSGARGFRHVRNRFHTHKWC